MNHQRRIIALLLFVLFVIPVTCYSKHLYPESYYRDIWCDDNNGSTEYRMPDGTIADCLTTKYAVELEFASSWYESVAQALHYAMLSGHKAGIVLIIETDADLVYWKRLVALKKYYRLPLTLWKIYP